MPATTNRPATASPTPSLARPLARRVTHYQGEEPPGEEPAGERPAPRGARRDDRLVRPEEPLAAPGTPAADPRPLIRPQDHPAVRDGGERVLGSLFTAAPLMA